MQSEWIRRELEDVCRLRAVSLGAECVPEDSDENGISLFLTTLN